VNKFVWVFNGNSSRFPSGVFSSLSGILTCYPLDLGVYDWAIREDFFKITKEKHKAPHFIGLFSSAHQEHIHFENGEPG